MQLCEDGKLTVEDELGSLIPEVLKEWKEITVIQLLRHSSGLPDYRQAEEFDQHKTWTLEELLNLAGRHSLQFRPGTDVQQSATNFLLLTEIVERVSKVSYHDFITRRQIEFLGLRHTGFAEDLDKFVHEDVSLSGNVHQLFKKDGLYISPTEPAASYDENHRLIQRAESSALRGFSDIWASAQDISLWDIGLAGAVLIHEPQNRALIYKPWILPDGREVPAVAGWQFYHHRGLMDIKGSVEGFSSFLSRFTDPEELVCVTLLANKEGVDFTNLGRRIAAAFGDLLSTNYDDNSLYLSEGQFSVSETVSRLEKELESRGIPVFAKFDHAENAKNAGLDLRPTTVLVFGSPSVGTGLMQADQSIALELPLRIAVWEDGEGSTWLAFPGIKRMMAEYGLESHPAAGKIQKHLQELVYICSNVYYERIVKNS